MTTKQKTTYAANRRLQAYKQDRWIQTELVFTLRKNATKSNPFKITLLQTTRKENNWKTEETWERAAVTLETERIKGSNPWCILWWWWWWWVQKGHRRYTQIKSYSPPTRSGIIYTNPRQHCAKEVTLYRALTVHHTGTRSVTNRRKRRRRRRRWRRRRRRRRIGPVCLYAKRKAQHSKIQISKRI